MTTLIQSRRWKQCFLIDIWHFGIEIFELFTVCIVGAYMNAQGTPFIYGIALPGQNAKFSGAFRNTVDKLGKLYVVKHNCVT